MLSVCLKIYEFVKYLAAAKYAVGDSPLEISFYYTLSLIVTIRHCSSRNL